MISIVIPTYEQRGYGLQMLRHLLISIQGQGFRDFEIVVSDNSKDDQIKNYVESAGLGIVYVRNNHSYGASENINNAIDHARYDKVKIMCQDDLFIRSDGLARFNKALDSHGWAISNSRITDQHGTPGRRAQTKYIHGQFDKNTVGMPSCIAFRKNHLRFDARLKTFCDLLFYYQLYELYGEPFTIKEFCVAQRYWPGSQSRNQPPTHGHDKQLAVSLGLIKLANAI